MSKMDISWQEKNTPTIPLQQENDVMLMEYILENNSLTPTEVKR